MSHTGVQIRLSIPAGVIYDCDSDIAYLQMRYGAMASDADGWIELTEGLIPGEHLKVHVKPVMLADPPAEGDGAKPADVSRETTPAGDVSRETLPVVLIAIYIAALIVFCALEHRVLFSWPDGIVTGNLLASAIWAPIAVVHLDRLARRHHRQRSDQAERHHAEMLEAAAPGPSCPRCECTCGAR